MPSEKAQEGERALIDRLADECENRMRIHEAQRDPTGERLWDELEHRGAVRALAGMARILRNPNLISDGP